jgi:Domain of unknown function (DUF1963)
VESELCGKMFGVRSAEFRTAILGVVARAAEVRETFAAEVQERRDAAVGARLVSGETQGLLSALPVAARRGHQRRVGRWLPDDSRAQSVGRVLLDSEARPLLHERVRDGYVFTLWRYDSDRTEEVHNWGASPRVTWVLPLGAVGVDVPYRWVQRWTRRNDQIVRVDHAEANPGGWASASATEADVNAAGEVRALRDGVEEGEYRDDNRLGEDDWLSALEAALERAPLIACDRRNWIAARDAPAPLRIDTSGLGRWLADALADALSAAAADVALPAAFCMLVTAVGDERPPLPPLAWLGDDRWRRGVTATSPGDRAALSSLLEGVDSGAVVELHVTERLDDDALRACAEIGQALDIYAEPADIARAEPVYAELADRLTARLAEPGRVPGETPEFLPLVALGDRHRSDALGAALERARRVLGDARVARFTDTLRSRAPARKPPPAKLAKQALRDRDALEQLLSALALTAHAKRLAHDVAEVGLLLRDAGGRAGGSRLGGPALLPPGTDWPTGAHERPLSFLAAIDLAELPPADGRPGAGWWLFFADLGEDEHGEGFFEPERNTPAARARLLSVAAGATPEPATPPGDELDHRPVTFEPVLTLPSDYDAAGRLGLDAYEKHAYQAALDVLENALGEPSWMGDQHWVGGHVTNAQGEPPEPDTVLLLHMADDDSLGFSFLDAGTIQFRIPADALLREDYSAVRAEPSSG